MVLGQHKHDVHLRVKLAKAAYGVHEHGHAVDGDKLLRYVAAHAQAFSSCHDNGVVHLLFLLVAFCLLPFVFYFPSAMRWLYIMPSLSDATVSSPLNMRKIS